MPSEAGLAKQNRRAGQGKHQNRTRHKCSCSRSHSTEKFLAVGAATMERCPHKHQNRRICKERHPLCQSHFERSVDFPAFWPLDLPQKLLLGFWPSARWREAHKVTKIVHFATNARFPEAMSKDCRSRLSSTKASTSMNCLRFWPSDISSPQRPSNAGR